MPARKLSRPRRSRASRGRCLAAPLALLLALGLVVDPARGAAPDTARTPPERVAPRLREPAAAAAAPRVARRLEQDADTSQAAPRVVRSLEQDADTSEAAPRVVRRLEEIVVRATALHDPLSSETVHRVSREALRTLPVDRFADALALKAGLVARGEDLHVRGGRAGDVRLSIRGIPLNDPLRGRPMDVPLIALESAEIVTGGADAEHGGALAGIVEVRAVEPGDRLEGEVRRESDTWADLGLADATQYERLTGRLGGPLWGRVGLVAGADLLADDTHLPALRTRPSRRSWRADNRLLGFAKLAPLGAAPSVTVEVLASRRVERPYNPMWSLDGFTTLCTGPFCSEGAAYLPDTTGLGPAAQGYERYRAADHAVMTDERRLAVVLSGWRRLAAGRLTGAAGYLATRRLASVGGRDDESYLDPANLPIFARPESPRGDPFRVHRGDEPFFQKAGSESFTLRSDYAVTFSGGSRYGAGAGVSYERVRMREIDLTTYPTRMTGVDSLRVYRAGAPGSFVYGQGRWIFEGLVLNGGLRLEGFTAGREAATRSPGHPARTLWSLSPRLGVAFPVSVRDVLSLAYVRTQQNPARDFLYDNRARSGHRQPLGNPALAPATVISYQVALKRLFDSGRALQAGVFYRDLFGQIGARSFQVEPGVERPRYENADRGHAEGFELGLVLPVREGLRLEAQYTFLHAIGTQSLEEGIPFGGRTAPRVEPTGDRPLDWDRRHSIALSGVWRRPASPAPGRPPRGPFELALRGLRGAWWVSWSTFVGSGLPWTPSPRRVLLTDLSLVNSRRFAWEERTSLAVRWTPSLGAGRLNVGLDVRNLFDSRSERAATLYGYPHPVINTRFDDYGAHRGETGLPGGGYWDDRLPGWASVGDPRLFHPPRAVRLSAGVAW